MDLPLVQIEETEFQVEIVEAPPIVVQVLESEIEVSEAEAEVSVAVVNPPPISIEIQEETTQVVEASTEEVVIVEPASVGMQGPPGEPGDLIVTDHLAGEALGGHRGVIVGSDNKLYYADQSNPAHFNRVLGITTGAAAQDNPASVRVGGKMTEPSWNWDLDKFIYLGTNGLLTQTPPAAGFLLEMGWPINSTTILVDIKLPVLLA